MIILQLTSVIFKTLIILFKQKTLKSKKIWKKLNLDHHHQKKKERKNIKLFQTYLSGWNGRCAGICGSMWNTGFGWWTRWQTFANIYMQQMLSTIQRSWCWWSINICQLVMVVSVIVIALVWCPDTDITNICTCIEAYVFLLPNNKTKYKFYKFCLIY